MIIDPSFTKEDASKLIKDYLKQYKGKIVICFDETESANNISEDEIKEVIQDFNRQGVHIKKTSYKTKETIKDALNELIDNASIEFSLADLKDLNEVLKELIHEDNQIIYNFILASDNREYFLPPLPFYHFARTKFSVDGIKGKVNIYNTEKEEDRYTIKSMLTVSQGMAIVIDASKEPTYNEAYLNKYLSIHLNVE